MQRGVEQSARSIAVLSPAYMQSVFGASEWQGVFVKDPNGEKGLLIPVRVDDFKPPGLLSAVI
jgi:hypothetical protein